MRKTLIVFAILLLIPVAVFAILRQTDFSFRTGEAPPAAADAMFTAHMACALAALVWLCVAVVRKWGHILRDLKSKSGAVCVLLAVASAVAWAWYLGLISLAGMWYNLP